MSAVLDELSGVIFLFVPAKRRNGEHARASDQAMVVTCEGGPSGLVVHGGRPGLLFVRMLCVNLHSFVVA